MGMKQRNTWGVDKDSDVEFTLTIGIRDLSAVPDAGSFGGFERR